MKDNEMKAIQNTLRSIYSECLPPENGGAFTSIIEISRISGLPPQLVLAYLLREPVALDNYRVSKIVTPPPIDQKLTPLQNISIPRRSKSYDRFRSDILNESQRYARRFILTSGALSRPTRNRYESRVSQQQILKTKVGWQKKDFDRPQPLINSEDQIRRKWISRSTETQIELPPKVILYSKIVEKYDLFNRSDGITRKFRLSGDIFPVTPSLLEQLNQLQKIFFGPNGVFTKPGDPKIIRLDLGVTPKETLKIFEVEGDKTNGFGYSACADLVRGNDRLLPGLPEVISNLVGDETLAIPMGQRFYVPEMIALAQILRENNTVNARAISKDDDKSKFKFFLNWPENWGRPPSNAQIIIPVNPKYGNKSFLTEIPTLYPEISQFLPETRLITPENIEKVRQQIYDNPGKYIIKKTLSSGGSGVALTPENIGQFLKLASANPSQFITQERVNQTQFPFFYIEPGEKELKINDMFIRLEAYLSIIGIAAVLITARTYLPVQGAKDAIMISASTT